eukprot:TRINITY_DN10295_c0_g1_i1.p1 TRINITY_DN10295_c0_g1~~TRINITY_DN10295_c0_g1_i1.p1  ORF type:complete len:297 (+),score=26.30 TRINITY_DN10295_c0_g1_i1:60-950(+)
MTKAAGGMQAKQLFLFFSLAVLCSLVSSQINVNFARMLEGAPLRSVNQKADAWTGSFSMTKLNATLKVCASGSTVTGGFGAGILFGQVSSDGCWIGNFILADIEDNSGNFRLCPTNNFQGFSGYFQFAGRARQWVLDERRLDSQIPTSAQCFPYDETQTAATIFGRWTVGDDVDEFYQSPNGRIFSRYKLWGGGFRELSSFSGGQLAAGTWWDGTGFGLVLFRLVDENTMLENWFTANSILELNIGGSCVSTDVCDFGVIWKRAPASETCLGRNEEQCKAKPDCHFSSGLCLFTQK